MDIGIAFLAGYAVVAALLLVWAAYVVGRAHGYWDAVRDRRKREVRG